MSVVKINAITVPADSGDELARRFAARAGAVDDQEGFQVGGPAVGRGLPLRDTRRVNAGPRPCSPARKACAISLSSARAAGTPIAQGDDVFAVLPATLPEDELARRLSGSDAAVVMKVGRHLAKVRRALATSGRLPRAIYVERGTMADAKMIPLAARADDDAPYFAIVLVPGWEERR